MHQFEVQSIFDGFELGGQQIAFTNSALWMALTVGVLWLFMLGGMKRQLVPGRWQAAVEGVVGFVDDMLATNIGPERSEEHTSELQSRMRLSYAVSCLKKQHAAPSAAANAPEEP